jgi:outer membrane protein assembly factor BamD (BamD/ComL family)
MRRVVCALSPLLLCCTTGCLSSLGIATPWEKAIAKNEAPKESLTLTGGRGLEREAMDPVAKQELDAARQMMDQQKYAEAEVMFHKLVRNHSEPRWWEIGPLAPAENKEEKERPKGRMPRGINPVCEGALFYEAECQRLQKNYRDAANTYTKLLQEYRQSQYTQGVCKGLFEIANYWLEPTRRQMDEYQQQIKGERWFVTPATYFHFSNDWPALDAEGHAVLLLNNIRLHDIKGELGRQALLYLGTIHFYRQEYKDADFYFTRYHEEYPNDKDAAKAVKQSVICKQLLTGGSVYDLRGVDESKKLLMTAMGAYPELAKDADWVNSQLTSINTQQADRDMKIAQFYERTGHPGSAYFYYELVCRRYPNSDYATKASERKVALKSKADRDQQTDREPLPIRLNPELQAPMTPLVPIPPRPLPPNMPGF